MLADHVTDDDLLARYRALVADTPRYLLDQIFGPGKNSYEPDFSGPEYAHLNTLADDANAAAAAAAVPTAEDSLDALIAAFVKADQLRQPNEQVQPVSSKSRKKRSDYSSDTVAEDNKTASADDALMFNKACFDQLQESLKVPCSIEACAPNNGSNPLLPDFCTIKAFLQNDFDQGNKMMFLFPPRSERELILSHYRAIKKKQPSIGACILLPAKYGSPLLKGMQLHTRYARNSPIFTDITTGSSVKCKCDFAVWIDAPSVDRTEQLVSVAELSTAELDNVQAPLSNEPGGTSHIMQLVGTAAGIPAHILFDSGAEKYNYISADFCSRNHIAVQPNKLTVTVKGVQNNEGTVHGQCTLNVVMQSLSSKLHFVVIDMPTAFDIILGDAWLKQMHTQLDYESGTCTVKKGKRSYVLHMRQPKPDVNPHAAHVKSAILNYAQAKRIFKEQVWHCLVLVRPKQDDDAVVASTITLDESTADHSTDARVIALKNEYPTVFTDHPPYGGSQIQIEHEVIPVEPGSNPVLRGMYRYSPMEMEEMEKQITNLLDLGYIRPSQSPYGAPVLFVKKPRSTELRMVVDYRVLNSITKRIGYPLPRIDTMLDHLAGAKVFSLIDLRQAYHQAKLLPSDVPRTAFRTPLGHYEYLTLSFGLVNAPAAFQSIMNKIFAQHLYKFVMVYLDDILVFSKNEADHAKHLRIVLDILKSHNLTAAIFKCKFYKSQVLFLGHIISGEGVRVDPDKVAAVNAYPTPTDVSDVRSFLGMAT